MKKNITKNLIIIILITLAVYQTMTLWFGENVSLDYFISIIRSNDISLTSEEASQIAKPYRLIATPGNRDFYIVYNNLSTNQLNLLSEKALGQLMSKGSFLSSYALESWDNLLDRKSIILEYNFNMPSDVFQAIFDNNSSVLSSKFNIFQYIFFFPSQSSEKNIDVVFLDYVNKMCYEYQIANFAESGELFIHTAPANQINMLKHTASALENMNYIDGNEFIPFWNDENYIYSPLVNENPYEQYGQIGISSVEKEIDVFFDNPAIKIPSSQNNDAYIFSDENTVVKYHTSGLLEYYDYRTVSAKPKNTFLSSYLAAVEMIKKDKNISNEYYLSDYKLENGIWTFYFDMCINNFNIFMPETTKSKLGLEHMIEINVSNDHVSRYKRYVAKFSIDQTTELEASKQFQDVILNYISDYENEENALKNINIGYKLDESETLDLFWNMEMYGSFFSDSVR